MIRTSGMATGSKFSDVQIDRVAGIMINFRIMISGDYNSKDLNDKENILKKKLERLISEIEALKSDAEVKIQDLEKTAKDRLVELELKMGILEEQVRFLNQVLASMDPEKRIN